MIGSVVASLFFASAAHAQCTKDIECKGDRVCHHGECVAPSEAMPATAPTAPKAPDAAAADTATAAPDDAAKPDAGTADAPDGAVEGASPADAAASAEPQPKKKNKKKNKRKATEQAQGAHVIYATAEPGYEERRGYKDPNETHARSPAIMTTGIVVAVAAIPTFGIGTVLITNKKDECDAKLRAQGQSTWGPTSCQSATSGDFMALVVGSLILVAIGVPLIFYGAKQVSDDPPVALTPQVSPSYGGLSLRLKL